MGKATNPIQTRYYIFGVPIVILVIMIINIVRPVIGQMITNRDPDLQAIVDCENWKTPICVIETIENLAPYEVNSIGCVKSMYTILVANKGGYVSENVVFISDDAKYIEYKKEGEEIKPFRNRRYVSMGDLAPSLTIEMSVWTTCPVCRQPKFKITQNSTPAKIHVRIPVSALAAWVNKHPKIHLSLILLSVFSICFFAYQLKLRGRQIFYRCNVKKEKATGKRK